MGATTEGFLVSLTEEGGKTSMDRRGERTREAARGSSIERGEDSV